MVSAKEKAQETAKALEEQLRANTETLEKMYKAIDKIKKDNHKIISKLIKL